MQYPKLLPAFLLLTLVASCVEKSAIPPDVIGQEKMILILTDIHLLEGAFYTIHMQNPDSSLKVSYKGYNTILKKHGTGLTAFRTSWEFYMKHPEWGNPVYEKVIENLSMMQTEGMRKAKKRKLRL